MLWSSVLKPIRSASSSLWSIFPHSKLSRMLNILQSPDSPFLQVRRWRRHFLTHFENFTTTRLEIKKNFSPWVVKVPNNVGRPLLQLRPILPILPSDQPRGSRWVNVSTKSSFLKMAQVTDSPEEKVPPIFIRGRKFFNSSLKSSLLCHVTSTRLKIKGSFVSF